MQPVAWRLEQDWWIEGAWRRAYLEPRADMFAVGLMDDPPTPQPQRKPSRFSPFIELVDFAFTEVKRQLRERGVSARRPVPTVPFEPATYTKVVRHWRAGEPQDITLAVVVASDGARLVVDGITEYAGPTGDVLSGLLGAARRARLRLQATNNAERVAVLERGATVAYPTTAPLWSEEVWTPPGGPRVTLRMHALEHVPDSTRDAQWRCALAVRGVHPHTFVPIAQGVLAIDTALVAAVEFEFILARMPPATRFRCVHAADALDGLVLTRPAEPGSRSLRLGPLRLGGDLVSCDVSWDGYEVRLVERTPLLCLVAAARILRPLSLL